MANLIIPEITIDTGTLSLGKYTFPKIAALLINVMEVRFTQSAK